MISHRIGFPSWYGVGKNMVLAKFVDQVGRRASNPIESTEWDVAARGVCETRWVRPTGPVALSRVEGAPTSRAPVSPMSGHPAERWGRSSSLALNHGVFPLHIYTHTNINSHTMVGALGHPCNFTCGHAMLSMECLRALFSPRERRVQLRWSFFM